MFPTRRDELLGNCVESSKGGVTDSETRLVACEFVSLAISLVLLFLTSAISLA